MKHFRQIRRGIDVAPYVAELSAHPELWEIDTSRQKNIRSQRDTQAIMLFCHEFGASVRAHTDPAMLDTEARRSMPIRYRGRQTPQSETLLRATAFIQDFTDNMKGVPGRAVIARLKPNGTIYPHIDDRLYWLLRDRYHLVLKSANGSQFRAGGEEVRMQEGELWWFDPTVLHEGFNDSNEPRIHIIMDILSLHSLGSYIVRLMRSPLRTVRATVKSLLRRQPSILFDPKPTLPPEY